MFNLSVGRAVSCHEGHIRAVAECRRKGQIKDRRGNNGFGGEGEKTHTCSGYLKGPQIPILPRDKGRTVQDKDHVLLSYIFGGRALRGFKRADGRNEGVQGR